jgi:hypothetical protein
MPLYGAGRARHRRRGRSRCSLLWTISEKAEAADTLLLFAARIGVTIALLLSVIGLAIARALVGHNLERDAPVFATMSIVFRVRYMFEELGLEVYTL